MAVFSTSAALLCVLLLHAGLLTISSEPDPTIIPWDATSNPLAMTPYIRNIIDALIGTNDFGSWATVLNGSDSPTLPLSATFFIPADQTLSHASIQSYIDQATFLAGGNGSNSLDNGSVYGEEDGDERQRRSVDGVSGFTIKSARFKEGKGKMTAVWMAFQHARLIWGRKRGRRNDFGKKGEEGVRAGR